MKIWILAALLPVAVLGVCEWHEYTCSNGNCVDPTKTCDGVNDCGDYSDENSRAKCQGTCPNGDYRCGTGKCIAPMNRCDGYIDCEDSSDESSAAGCVIDKGYKCHVCSSSSLLEGNCLDPFNNSDVTFCQHGCHKLKTVTNGVITIRRQCLTIGSPASCASIRADSMYGSGRLYDCGCQGDMCNSAHGVVSGYGVHLSMIISLYWFSEF